MRSIRYIVCLALVLSMLMPVAVSAVSEPVLGDINGDRQVTTDDVIDLLLHVSLPDQFPITAKADFTGDSLVTTDDVIQLLLHISMPDEFPLEPGILEVTPGWGDNRD